MSKELLIIFAISGILILLFCAYLSLHRLYTSLKLMYDKAEKDLENAYARCREETAQKDKFSKMFKEAQIELKSNKNTIHQLKQTIERLKTNDN